MSTSYRAQLCVAKSEGIVKYEALKRFIGFNGKDEEGSVLFTPLKCVTDFEATQQNNRKDIDQLKEQIEEGESSACRLTETKHDYGFIFSESGESLAHLSEVVNLFLSEQVPDFVNGLRLLITEYDGDSDEDEYAWYYVPKDGKLELSTGHHWRTSIVILF